MWRDLNVHIGDRCILNKVNGTAKPGEMLAVIGQTGAGNVTKPILMRFTNDIFVNPSCATASHPHDR